jgi:hypothetical protein
MIDEMRVSAGSSRAAALGVFVDVFVNLDVSHQPVRRREKCRVQIARLKCGM